MTTTPNQPNAGSNILGPIGLMVSLLMESPLLSQRQIKVNIGGRLADLRPILRAAARDISDGNLSPADIQDIINETMRAVLSAQPAPPHAPPGVPTPTPTIPTPPPGQPSPTLPPPIVVGNLSITRIEAESQHTEGERVGGSNAGQLYFDASHVLMAGERRKFNYTPYSGSIRIPDEVNRRWMADGHSPIVQPRWGVVEDGREVVMTSGEDRPDHFGLEGYDRLSSPNAGWTHVLYMPAPFGSGQTKCFDYVFVPAEFNNGQRVESPRFYFQAD